MDSSTSYALGGAALAAVLGCLLLQPTGLVKWLQRKNYQYEVTFSLYMLTPTEKFVFNSILFLATAMLLIASILYLPDHVTEISRRTYYYFLGDAELHMSSRQAAETLYGTAARAGDTVLEVATGLAQTAYAAVNRSAAAAHEATSSAASSVVAH